jgi:alkylated DNA repair protein (DNA oxidative demethylase)
LDRRPEFGLMQVMSQAELFENTAAQPLPAGIWHRSGLLGPDIQAELARAVAEIAREAPFTHPRMKGKGMFSAAITNAGDAGWWSDERGYRYEPAQPGTARPWPKLPAVFVDTVARAVAGTPWPAFASDACLINFYGAGAKMGLHQDKDERDFSQPIVTVSLGDDADFLIGGAKRADPARAIRVRSGDVVIMGPPSRMLFHGVRRVLAGTSPIPGVAGRYSLTFRKAL